MAAICRLEDAHMEAETQLRLTTTQLTDEPDAGMALALLEQIRFLEKAEWSGE
jgi:hypothetical protein